MFELHLEPWELLPPNSEEGLALVRRVSYPPLGEGETPEPGKFYRLYPKDRWGGNNDPYHGSLRVGKDPEKLVVFFNGGGVSYNEYTAARPGNLFTTHMRETYYFNDAEWMGDYPLLGSMQARRPDNPFADWSFIDLPYASGDFHCGDGDFPYTALDGSPRVLKHHGWRNVMAVLDMARTYLPKVKKLLIAGVSAGGFGTALLSDDVIGRFSECGDITVAVDSSLLFKDWERIAREVWHSPEHIRARMTGDNLTLDCLTALHEKHGGRVRILFMSSVRDALLVEAQNGLDGNGLSFDKAAGKRYQQRLTEMCRRLMERIPGVGLYIFDAPMDQPGFDDSELTKHCLLDHPLMYDHREEGRSACEWLADALDGKVTRIGLAHLGLTG